MKYTNVLLIVCFLVVAFAGGTLVDAKANYSSTAQSTTANSSTDIQITVSPEQNRMQGDPLIFTVDVYNSHEEDTRNVFLEIGASPPEDELRMEVSGDEPWYEHENKMLWAKNIALEPETSKLVAIVIYPESQIGNYELNATASYTENGNYIKKYGTSTLIIESHPCSTLRGWLECNSWVIERLLPIFMFVLGLLSFVGYERIQNWLFSQSTTNREETPHSE